jgi:hypothetical protein
MLGQSEFVSTTPDGKRIIGWLVPDATGALTRYPAEIFGPMPEYREKPRQNRYVSWAPLPTAWAGQAAAPYRRGAAWRALPAVVR